MRASQKYWSEELLRRLVLKDRHKEERGDDLLTAVDRQEGRRLVAVLERKTYFSDVESETAAAIVGRHENLFDPRLVARMNGKIVPEQPAKT